MWLDHFFFCGVSVSPTNNFLPMADVLADSHALPMGKYLLGSAYLLLHQVSVELRSGRSVKNLGGPWWFIQMWLSLHTTKAIDLDLSVLTFPGNHAESATPRSSRCISFGEALSMAPGAAMSDDTLAYWFAALYKGLNNESTDWYPYIDFFEKGYDTPFLIDPTFPTADREATKIFTTCLRPCLLPTGLIAGSKAFCSYEFYHPSVAARQLGFGQLPPSLFYVGQIKARATVDNAIQWNWLVGRTADVVTGDLAGFSPAPRSTRLFDRWWGEWNRHLRSRNTASVFSGLVLGEPFAEVRVADLFL
jgi:hypothetical protein